VFENKEELYEFHYCWGHN